jgi:eukaryotic-like serine/threonine-protein kinase
VRPACDEALAIYGAELDTGHIAVARTQACRGSALVGLGRTREAIAPLERARQTLGAREDAVEAAAVDASLARALWETGARDRALALAAAARDVYAAAPGRTRALAELEAWLAPRKR